MQALWTTRFNPRARVGRDAHERDMEIEQKVSIHAPAWGATHTIHNESNIWSVSIHAPAWGATLNQLHYSITQMFQSTRPRGARLDGRIMELLI